MYTTYCFRALLYHNNLTFFFNLFKTTFIFSGSAMLDVCLLVAKLYIPLVSHFTADPNAVLVKSGKMVTFTLVFCKFVFLTFSHTA